MTSFLVAAVAALAAAVGTGLLVRDCVRLPRIELIGWLVAAAGLTIALAAQALGSYHGYGPATFRAVQLGAQLLAPLALTWGLAEVTGRSVGARFASRLALAGITIVAGVILAMDPLNAVAYGKTWPAASVYYGIIPNGVLTLLAGGTVLAAVTALLVAGVRSRREPGWQGAFGVVAAGGAAVVAVQLLRLTLPVNSAYPAVCLLAAGLAWFAGSRSDVARLGVREAPAAARGHGYPDEDDDYDGLYRPDDSGYRSRRDDTGWGQFGPDTGYGPGADTGYGYQTGSHDISDTGYGFYRDDTGGLRAVTDTGYGLYRDDTGGMVFGDGPGSGFGDPDTGAGVPGPVPGAAGEDGEQQEEEGTARLYGQIAIYTLLEGRAEDFDRLAQDIVTKVKAREPETLVFVMHGVPSAPMQRILYEVYRDQAAYEHHAEQPYIREFEEQRKPFVLATNVIELGVRQAKVLPLLPGVLAGPAPEPAVPARSVPGRSAPGRSAPPRPAVPVQPASAGADERLTRSRPHDDGADPGLPRFRPHPDGADPGLPRFRPHPDGADPGPPRPRTGPHPSGSRAGPQPSRSRADAQPSLARDAQQPDPSRARRSDGSARTDGDFWARGPAAPEDPDDGDFWTRGPAAPEDPDDGDFWGRGSRGNRRR
jgi:quinol monooxygenase YgiN